jgi:predicted O-methyltransferase YrrM
MTKLDKIKKEAIETHIPIMMDDTLDKITEIIGSRKLHRILEIGTATGYSALCFEKLLDDDGIIDTIERDEERIAKAKENFELMKVKNINLYEGDAYEIIQTLDNKYDMVFIDANKGKYDFYLDHALRMLSEDGIIFADNILYKGYVMSGYNLHKQRTAVTHLRNYIKKSTEDERLESKIYEVGDGLEVTTWKK